jgi:hypothetical protein
MGMLNREALLTREKLEVKKVDLGDDEFVFVREMYASEKNDFENSIMEWVPNEDGKYVMERKLDHFRAKLAVCTVCDEIGTNLFTVEDIEALSKSISAARLEKISDVASMMNAIGPADKAALVKNSDAVPSGNSSSG